MPSPGTPPKSIFHPNSRGNFMKELQAAATTGATAEATAVRLALANRNRIQTLPTRNNMITIGAGGAPMKRYNARAAAAAARQAPRKMKNQGEVRLALNEFFKAANLANAFGN